MRWTSALVLPLLLLSCSGDEPSSGAESDDAQYELHEWTTVLPQEALDAIASRDDAVGTLRFRGAPESVRARAPGDVIVGGKSAATPRGILRVVVSVTPDGEDTVLETMPVALPLAFKRLHARVAPRVADVAAPSEVTGTRALEPNLTPSVYKSSKVVGGARVFDAKVYDQDENPETKDDQFYVHAELSGQVGYSATVDLDWLDDAGAISKVKDCLKKIATNPLSALGDCVPSIPDVRVSFETFLRGNGLLDVEGAASKEYASPPIYLNEEPWVLPDLVVGPIVLTPELDFTARVEGDAATAFHARTEFGYDVSVGASAGLRGGVTPPVPTFTKTVSRPVVEVSSTGRSKASFGPRLSLLAYDTFGFYADLHGAGELTADKAKTPCWDYKLGVDVTPGVRLRVPWKKFGLQQLAKKLGWDGDIVDKSFGAIPLYEDHPFADDPPNMRACGDPPTSSLPVGEGPSSETYLNPTFTPWSYRISGAAADQPYVAYDGSSKALVDKGHDASWILSGAYFGAVLDLSDAGDVRWARQVQIGQLPDERPVALNDMTESVVALASNDMRIFAAADRFTLLAFDYDGTLAWAKRLRAPEGLPEETMIHLSPVSMVKLPGGDFAVLYAPRTVEGTRPDEIVLLRSSPNGELRFAKRFRFPTGDDSLGVSLVAVDDELVLLGHSVRPQETIAYLARFDAAGAVRWAKRLDACGSSRVRLASGVRRASGDLAIVGTFEISPERGFFATVSPDGVVRGSTATWTDANAHFSTVTLAELPTTGFVTLDHTRPLNGDELQLSTRDSLGIRTGGKGYALKHRDGAVDADLRPAALRLTTDGGVIAVAHVHHDKASFDHGLWISKLPARTFEAPFDPAHVRTAPDALPNIECAVTTSPAELSVADAALDGVDVADIVKLNPLTPLREAR